jgi:hypothetical protein
MLEILLECLVAELVAIFKLAVAVVMALYCVVGQVNEFRLEILQGKQLTRSAKVPVFVEIAFNH